MSTNRAHLKPTDLYEFDKDKGEQAFKRSIKLHKQFEKNNLVTCFFGPQALDMISLDLLKNIQNEAAAKNSKIQVSLSIIRYNFNSGVLAETKAEPILINNFISENDYAGIICRIGAKPILTNNLITLN